MSWFFIDVQHGLCNRLRALSSAAAIAQKSGRQLVVIWCPDHHCQCRLSDIIEYDGAVIEDEATAELLRRRTRNFWTYMEIEENACFQKQIIGPEVVGDVYVRSAYTLKSPLNDYDLEQQFLRGLHPTDAVLDLVACVPHPNSVAMHVRMGTGQRFDHLSYEAPENWPASRHKELSDWRQKSHMKYFAQRLDQLVSQGQVDRVFLAADLPEVYCALIDRYGDRICTLQRDLFDRSARQIQYALADLLLLSAAPLFLASSWSSFSDLAQRLAAPNRRVEKSGVDF